MSSAGLVTISPIRDSFLHFAPAHSQESSESIFVYVATPGSLSPMRVLESDSIESVKLRIQSCKGFVTKNQKLVCGGRELARSNSSVRDYGVGDGNVLHLVIRLSDLLAINVKTSCGKEFNFQLERNRDVSYLKKQIAKNRSELVDIDEQEVLCNGEELEDQRLINDLCKHNDAVIHLFVQKSTKIRGRPVGKNFELSIEASQSNDGKEFDVYRDPRGGIDEENKKHGVHRKPPDKDFSLELLLGNPKFQVPSFILDMIKSTFEGLDNGNFPIRSSEGTGGAYFMPDSTRTKYLSVFKPIDEEPMAVNNPHGLPLSEDGEGLKKGTIVGEGAYREVAVYILDHPKGGRRSLSGEENGFAGVPPTILVTSMHKGFNNLEKVTAKIGSLQMFMENQGSCEDMGPSAFPVEEVHKISVFDIRMANADRHAGNILVSKDKHGKTILIPIDHGYCLPESFEDCTFDWLYWPQARQPYRTESIEYIKSLDVEEDIAVLKFHGWDLTLKCARTFRISTLLLKKGVEKGLTPFEIGNIMCRKTLKQESIIEDIVQEALDSVLPGASEAAILESVSEIMDLRLDEIVESRSR